MYGTQDFAIFVDATVFADALIRGTGSGAVCFLGLFRAAEHSFFALSGKSSCRNPQQKSPKKLHWRVNSSNQSLYRQDEEGRGVRLLTRYPPTRKLHQKLTFLDPETLFHH